MVKRLWVPPGTAMRCVFAIVISYGKRQSAPNEVARSATAALIRSQRREPRVFGDKLLTAVTFDSPSLHLFPIAS